MSENPSLSALTPGALLRQARETRGLSIESVALQLHLSPDVLDNLENDNYPEKPGIMFLKGYLRSYARFLQLDETQVMQAFDGLGIAASMKVVTPTKLLNLSTKPIKVRSRFRKGKFAFGVLIAMVIFLILWWYAHQSSNSNQIQQIGAMPDHVVATVSMNNSDTQTTTVAPTVGQQSNTSESQNTTAKTTSKAAQAEQQHESTSHRSEASITPQLHMDLGN